MVDGLPESAIHLRIENRDPSGVHFEVVNRGRQELWFNTAQVVVIRKPGPEATADLVAMVGLPYRDPTGPRSEDWVSLTRLEPSGKIQVAWEIPSGVRGSFQARSKAWTAEGRKKDSSLLHPDVASELLTVEIG